MKIITVRLSVTNCYLIQCGEGYLLVDTGYSHEWDLFKKQLAMHSVGVDDIKFLLMTHHDDDHSGLINRLVQENAAIRIVMSQSTKELLEIGKNDRSHGGGFLNKRIYFIIAKLSLKQLKLMVSARQFVPKNMHLLFPPYWARETDILIEKTTDFRDIGIDLDGKIFMTPGHSVDSVSAVFPSGDCLVGDAAANIFQFAGAHYCVIHICDLDQYYQSWETILKENVQMIFPSHGKPFPANMLRRYIWKNRKEDMVMD